jgi:hypothetical protein
MSGKITGKGPPLVAYKQRSLTHATSGPASLQSLPDELLGKVASNLSLGDMGKLRQVNRRLHGATEFEYHCKMADEGFTIYNHYASMNNFLATLAQYPRVPPRVKFLTIVEESFKINQYGTDWAWEVLLGREGARPTPADVTAMNAISTAHANETAINDNFVQKGNYRHTLFAILSECPNLETIHIRTLGVGFYMVFLNLALLTFLQPTEHIPGWLSEELWEGLSFHRQGGLPAKEAFYGRWRYDLQAQGVTEFEDEFGDVVAMPGGGDQVTFRDDLVAVVEAANFEGQIFFHDDE